MSGRHPGGYYVHADFLTDLQWAAELDEFARISFAEAPLEVRVFEGRRHGQERFPQSDADATGVP